LQGLTWNWLRGIIGIRELFLQGAQRVRADIPRIRLAGVKMAKNSVYFDRSEAVHDLKIPQTSVEKPSKNAVEWYFGKGYVRDRSSGGCNA
jgi:hypothetical protein